MSVTYSAGIVTAYGAAKQAGYTGTYQQFCQALADLAGIIAQATTLPAGSQATATYNNGTLSLGIPKGDKGDKGDKGGKGDTGATGPTGATGNGIVSVTKTGTSGLVDTYTITFTNGTTTTFEVTNGEDGEVTQAQLDEVANDVDDLKSANDLLYKNLINEETEASNPLVITDGGDGLPVKDCMIDIHPNQPNAYDSVWVGGAGKNLLSLPYHDGRVTGGGLTVTPNADGSITVSGSVSGTVNLNMKAINSASDLKAGNYIATCFNATGSANHVQMVVGGSNSAIPFKTITQATPASFTITTDYETLGYCLIQVTAGFSGTVTVYPMIRLASVSDDTWTPYSNICPISGWTSADIHRCGVNQWDEEWTVGWIGDSGNISSSTVAWVSKNFIPVSPSATYYLKNNGNAQYAVRVVEYDVNKQIIKGSVGWWHNVEKTMSTNTRFIKIARYETSYNHDISINYPSTDTAYHAYTGTTYSVDLSTAGTVYGGTLDVTTGVLTVTKKMLTLNGSENWNTGYYAAGYRYYIRTSQSDAKNETVMQSSAFNTTGAFLIIRNADAPKCVNFYANTEYSMFTTLSEFTTYLASNPVQAVYELATPQTYQLTPTEVTTLLKNNTLTANCGTVSLSYYADTKSYIDNAIATAVASL